MVGKEATPVTDATIIPATILQGKRLERHGFTFRNPPADTQVMPAPPKARSLWFSRASVRKRDVDWLTEGLKQMIETHGAAFVIDHLKIALAVAEQAEQEGR
jgi:hypothetical protein